MKNMLLRKYHCFVTYVFLALGKVAHYLHTATNSKTVYRAYKFFVHESFVHIIAQLKLFKEASQKNQTT